MKIRYYLAVIILVLASASVYVYLMINQPKPESVANDNFYSISELKQNNFSTGEFTVEGYVVKIYTCPFCPTGWQCKPCMRNNLIISENNRPLANYSLTNKELIVFFDKVQLFELGQKYKFFVKVLDDKSTSELINDIEITGFNLIK